MDTTKRDLRPIPSPSGYPLIGNRLDIPTGDPPPFRCRAASLTDSHRPDGRS
jgi:hypothetical protein